MLILSQRLAVQLQNLNIPFTEDFESDLKSTNHVVDAIFGISLPRLCSPPESSLIRHLGFSFSGEVRAPFSAIITALEHTSVAVTSVDTPSSWSIEDGPPKSGPGAKFQPANLISLTAPKPLVDHFKGRHFIGGR